MFDMTFFAARTLHEPLRRLGAHDWCREVLLPGTESNPLPADSATTEMLLDYNLMSRTIGAERADRMIHGAGLDAGDSRGKTITVAYMSMLSRCFAIGPKLLVLDEAICRVAAAMRLRVPMTTFAMPYPVMIVRFPQPWAAEVAAKLGQPNYEIMLIGYAHTPHYSRISSVLFTAGGIHDNRELFSSISTRDPGKTIEDCISLRGQDLGHQHILEGISEPVVTYDRIAMNVALLATYAGTKSLGWLDPAAHAKHAKLARRDERGQALLAGDVERIVFERDVHKLLGITFEERQPWAGGTHKSPGPYWRGRHWRLAHVGSQGDKRRELRPVREHMVRARALAAAGHTPDEIQANYYATLPEDPGDDETDNTPTR